MARKTGAPESEEKNEQGPTNEADVKDVVKEEAADEVPSGAAVAESEPDVGTEPETEPEGPDNDEQVVKEDPSKEVSEKEPESEIEEAPKAEKEIVEKTSPTQVSPPPAGPGRATLGEADPKMHVKKKKKMFRIILDEQDNSDKNNHQIVTDPSDGKQFLIKRGFEVDVPEGVVNNLRESIIDRLEYDANGEEVWRSIPRFAMRVIKELN